MITVTLFGDALEYQGSKNGVYHMQPGFSNGQRFWMSSEGNAIWHDDEGGAWILGPSENLGISKISFLYLPIKDPSKECPHDNLQSNWRYNSTENGFVEDVFNSVQVVCFKGT